MSIEWIIIPIILYMTKQYFDLYVKYKTKYLILKKQFGGNYKCNYINPSDRVSSICIANASGNYKTMEDCVQSDECINNWKNFNLTDSKKTPINTFMDSKKTPINTFSLLLLNTLTKQNIQHISIYYKEQLTNYINQIFGNNQKIFECLDIFIAKVHEIYDQIENNDIILCPGESPYKFYRIIEIMYGIGNDIYMKDGIRKTFKFISFPISKLGIITKDKSIIKTHLPHLIEYIQTQIGNLDKSKFVLFDQIRQPNENTLHTLQNILSIIYSKEFKFRKIIIITPERDIGTGTGEGINLDCFNIFVHSEEYGNSRCLEHKLFRNIQYQHIRDDAYGIISVNECNCNAIIALICINML
jgi:hypothetical protein